MTGVSALATTTTATSGTNSSSSSTAVPEAKDQFGKDTFLKLLVAQLKYQDPSNPADASEFLSQTAQFTVVEKLSELTEVSAQLLTASQSQSAASLIGKKVTWTDADGKSQSGVVTTATLGSAPTLTVGSQTVDLSAVTAVSTATG